MPAGEWGTRPARSPRGKAVALDAFVRDSYKGKTRRLNAEIPAALHAHVKSGCALEGRDIPQVVIELLEKQFPAQRDQGHSPPSRTSSAGA